MQYHGDESSLMMMATVHDDGDDDGDEDGNGDGDQDAGGAA